MSDSAEEKRMTEIKPATFKQGVPKAERNGFYGIEESIIADAGERIVAVVIYEVVRVMRDGAYKARTGTEALDLESLVE